MKEDIKKRIKKVIDKIQPHLAKDGGGVEFVNYDEQTDYVFVRFTGVCKDCPLRGMTLRAGIERFLIRYIPEVKRVEAIR